MAPPTDSDASGSKLEPLLNPLRFAARRDWANLSTLRDLERTLRRAVATVRADPAISTTFAAQLDGIEKQLDGLDAAPLSERRRRVEAMLRALEERPASPRSASPRSTSLKSRASRSRSRGEDEGLFRPPQGGEGVDTGGSRVSASALISAAPKARVRATTRRRIPMADAEPGSPLTEIVGVGPKTAERFLAKGIETAQDLMFFVPRQYEDRSRFSSIADLTPGTQASVRAEVMVGRVRPTGRGKRVLELSVSDGTGVVSCRFFRFPSRMEARYPRGTRVVVSGPVTAWGAQKQMVHPELELDEGGDREPQGILPVYGDVDGVPTRTVRRVVQGVARACGHRIEDILPDWMLHAFQLPSLSNAVLNVHLPDVQQGRERIPGRSDIEAMRARLVFDELLLLQLALHRTREQREEEPGLAHDILESATELATRWLPFSLTRAQERSLTEILGEMRVPRPMNRLLQGDVGSGKTAVALLAAAAACKAGRQAALLAPTEILADQHFASANQVLAARGLVVARLTGSATPKERRQLLRTLADGRVDVIVGTHALLEPDVRFQDLGLAVVDEQHRFGVHQRASLREKRSEAMPDLLLMTATPIPRTLALTAYGDLRVSVIDERPPGRLPTRTQVFRASETNRALDEVGAALAEGRQAYIVYPLVEASEKLDLTAATDAAVELADRFAPYEVGLLHGRMRSDEKAAVMNGFKSRAIDVLVSTTVIEVGVDVPNATVMLVMHADRFGLSQLHQLRGRVGRGLHPGTCLLVAGDASRDGWARLEVLAKTSDGFEVAEHDLALRGPGELLGTRQSGLPDLVVTDLARDGRTVEAAKRACDQLLARDAALAEPEHARLKEELERRYGARVRLTAAG